MKKLEFLLTVIFSGVAGSFFCQVQSNAPEVIATDGNFFSCSCGSISWTIGEPVSDTYLSTNALTKGFHQPKKIAVSNLSDLNKKNNLLAYPNPAADYLKLDFTRMEPGVYSIELFETSGKFLKQSVTNITGEKINENFDLSDFSNGLYLLKITNTANANTQSFRITKQE